MKNPIYSTFLLAVVFIFSACQKEIKTDWEYGIDPSTQTSLLCQSLRMAGINRDGEMPVGASGTTVLVSHPDAIEISAGILLYLPFTLTDPDLVCQLYIQVEGADNYWETLLTKDPTSGQPFFEILIPRFVREGQFEFVFSVEDCNGNISPAYFTQTTVKPTANCDENISGAVGITVRVFDMGDESGIARVQYEMYDIKDRLDLKYDGEWIASTGDLFNENVVIPDCSGSQNGFVSGAGELSFSYDPDISRYLEVYVSGCLDGTLWDLFVVCPE